MDSDRKQWQPESFDEEALQELLAIERRAEGIVRDAEDEANRTLASARKRIEEIKTTAAVEANQRSTARVQEGLRETEQRAQALQAQAREEAEAWKARAEQHLAQAVDYVLDTVALWRAAER